MAIAMHNGKLKKEVVVKQLGRNVTKLLEPGTEVKYYRNPVQLGVWVIEYQRVFFARIDAHLIHFYVD